MPYRIYRPSMVVGHSKTGEIDKIDGPYYLFTLIKKIRQTLPPMDADSGNRGGRINVVPVEFVATPWIISLTRRIGWSLLPSGCPEPMRFGELMNTFARAAHAPEMTMRLDARMFAFIPAPMRMAVSNLPPVKRLSNMILRDLKIRSRRWPSLPIRPVSIPAKRSAH